MVYNGDEVSGIVIDFGSHTTRAGYAGEDCPRVVCPSFYGYIQQATASTSSISASNGANTNSTNGDGDVPMELDGPASLNGATNGSNGGGDSKPSKSSGGSGRKYFVGDDGVVVWRDGMEVDTFMSDGVVTDAEPAAELLHHILHKRLAVDPTEHPLMFTEPAWNTTKSREILAQMAFEDEGVPAMYLGSAGVLSAFAAGKPTALVLDVGYSMSSAVPIVDGYALRAGTMRQPLGSALITSQIRANFTKPTSTRPYPLPLLPRHLISKRDPQEPGSATPPHPILRQDRQKGTTPSWMDWAQNNVVEQWKEACSEVVSTRGFDFKTVGSMGKSLYEFPDGFQGDFGEERFRFTEMLFDPKNYFDQSIEPPASLRLTPSSEHSHSLKDLVSLSQLVHDSVMACDVDVRAALLQNIVIVGNTSLTRGLTERLDIELAALLPSQKIKIHSPSIPFEKKYAAWLGGSILASLGTFHQLWVTKDEYEEHGMGIVHQRCK